MLHDLHLLRPLWLLALVPLAWVLWRQARATHEGDIWRSLVDAHLLPHLLTEDVGPASRTPARLLAAGGALGILALAGPVWQRLPQPVYQAQAQRVILLDLSPTMNATDVPPSRLAHARFEILDLLQRAREGQTALLAFGAEPFLVSPLTADAATIAAQVPNLDSHLLPTQGERRTDLALNQAGELLRQVGSADGEVILVTDGLDPAAATQEAARRLRADGYRISVLGIGSQQSAPVPLAGGGFLKDASGAILMPRLEQDALQSLANTGGGRYVTASADDRDVEALIPKDSARPLTQRIEHHNTQADQWREEGPWLLLALLPLAVLGFRRGWLGPLLLGVYLTMPPPAQAFEWSDLWLRPDQQGARQWAAGKSAEAAAHFQRPDWQAAAHYQAGDYAKALDALKQVESGEADYNRGNALARLGKLEEAVAAYDRALAAQPHDADARANRDLVRRLLDQQQQQQPSPSQNASDKDSQNHKDKKDSADKSAQNSPSPSDQQGDGDKKRNPSQNQSQDSASKSTAQKPQDSSAAGHPSEKPGQGQQDPRQAADESAKTDTNSEKSATASSHVEQKPTKDAAKPPTDAAQSGRADLLGDDSSQHPPLAPIPAESEDPSQREAHQAMEYRLNRVTDDPSGLLRQRFLLQHLRRTGELP
jgi:Ca-activated chloride channel homolog